MQPTEAHPPARTLVCVRTGASVVELKVPAFVRKPSQSNLSAVPSLSQHSKHASRGSVSGMRLIGSWQIDSASKTRKEKRIGYALILPYVCATQGVTRIDRFSPACRSWPMRLAVSLHWGLAYNP